MQILSIVSMCEHEGSEAVKRVIFPLDKRNDLYEANGGQSGDYDVALSRPCRWKSRRKKSNLKSFLEL